MNIWSARLTAAEERIAALEAERDELRRGLHAIREHMDGGWETPAGEWNVTVYDFDGVEMVDALLLVLRDEQRADEDLG